MKFRIGLVFFALLRLCFKANSECSVSKTCLALGSYYVWQGSNLTFIGELLSTTDANIVSYNMARMPNKYSVQSDTRINVPFTCDCINNSFLGHVFEYTVLSGDTYDKVASLYYANLTTEAAIMRFNEYLGNDIPLNTKLNVVVNCSCGNHGLLITYPLRPGDSLASIAEAESSPPNLLQSYNPGVNFSKGTGYVYIPGKVAGSRSHGRIIGISVGVSGAVLIVLCIMYITRKKMIFLKKEQRDELDIDAFIRNHGSITPKRYSYPDVVKMTNSFEDQIGKGGYGTVYKGKLPDGLLVAVKVLNESKGDGEEFINEVVSIGLTSHVNVVTLLGFCYQRNKRALIYEYMPNGSLDKFIHNQGSSEASCHLEWNTLSEIAVGVARGLEYLHRGCNTRILHFDIKPQNILLDKVFCPKIADFGLAKLCKTRESIVSMLGTRGTAGYIAPEVFSRNFGGVSHKSDVYSYGMLVLEMVGARRNLHSDMSRTSEMFPHYVYKDLELGNEESIFRAIPEEENETVRKMILVSLGCIQTMPSDRPSMSKVVEMLEGPLHCLTVPPKPFLFTPTESAINEQIISSEAEESMIQPEQSETW